MTTTPNPTAEPTLGWHEFILDGAATTHIAYVYEDGSIYFPEGPEVVTEADFRLASAAGRVFPLVRAAGLLGGGPTGDACDPEKAVIPGGGMSAVAPTEEQIERAHDAGMNAVDWDMVREGVGDPAEAASIAVRIALAAAGVAPQELSAHVNPLATSGERVRNQTDSSHVAPQEPSPVASTPTVSDDSGHGGDDDRGGREDGPEDEGRSHQATVAGPPQRPSGCAECHRASGHKMDCSHRLAPSPDREKLIAVRLYCENQGDKFRHHAGRILEMLDSSDALAARPVLNPEKVAEVIEYYYDVPGDRLDLIARALCEAAKRGELNAD